MPHPIAPRPQPTQKPKRRTQSRNKSLVLIALFVLLGGWGLGQWFGKSGGGALPVGAADVLTQKQIETRQNAFRQTVPVKSETAAQFFSNPTLASTLKHLSPSSFERVVELTVWDDVAEDGDVIDIITPYHTTQVMIRHTPQTVYLPAQSGSLPVQIRGVRDGGGGITLALQGSGTPISAPILAEGQIIQLMLQ